MQKQFGLVEAWVGLHGSKRCVLHWRNVEAARTHVVGAHRDGDLLQPADEKPRQLKEMVVIGRFELHCRASTLNAYITSVYCKIVNSDQGTSSKAH